MTDSPFSSESWLRCGAFEHGQERGGPSGWDENGPAVALLVGGIGGYFTVESFVKPLKAANARIEDPKRETDDAQFTMDKFLMDRPKLDVRNGTNLVQTSVRDSSTVWLDLLENDRTPEREGVTVVIFDRSRRVPLCRAYPRR